MSRHQYRLEPNVSFTPDQKWVVFRSNLFGAAFSGRTSALGRDGAVLGVSVTGAVAEGVQLSVGYTGDVRPSATAQVFSAGLQAAW